MKFELFEMKKGESRPELLQIIQKTNIINKTDQNILKNNNETERSFCILFKKIFVGDRNSD